MLDAVNPGGLAAWPALSAPLELQAALRYDCCKGHRYASAQATGPGACAPMLAGLYRPPRPATSPSPIAPRSTPGWRRSCSSRRGCARRAHAPRRRWAERLGAGRTLLLLLRFPPGPDGLLALLRNACWPIQTGVLHRVCLPARKQLTTPATHLTPSPILPTPLPYGNCRRS